MPDISSRRLWLKQTSLAALGLGFSFRSMGSEDGLTKLIESENKLINLGSNENPYGISAKARQAILDMMGETNRYQFNVTSLQPFKKQLANYYKVNEDQVIITPGSGDGLNSLARCFSKGNIVTADITFGVLPAMAKKVGTKVIEIPLTADKVHDLPAMLAAINNETQLVYICNPANPSSTFIKPATMKSFCIEAAKKTVVLIDEAYLDFIDPADNESMIGLIEKNPNILVIKTFSKIHAMAGLRIGFIVGHSTMINKIQSVYFQSSQIAVSNLSMAAAMASLADEEHKLMSKQKNEAARNYTITELKKMGISPVPSYTNFIFYPLKNYTGDFAQDMFEKHNIILRSNTYTHEKWARVSVGTIDEMQTFCSVIKEIKG
jgi:histidinol-phosphate aminotransferase